MLGMPSLSVQPLTISAQVPSSPIVTPKRIVAKKAAPNKTPTRSRRGIIIVNSNEGNDNQQGPTYQVAQLKEMFESLSVLEANSSKSKNRKSKAFAPDSIKDRKSKAVNLNFEKVFNSGSGAERDELDKQNYYYNEPLNVDSPRRINLKQKQESPREGEQGEAAPRNLKLQRLVDSQKQQEQQPQVASPRNLPEEPKSLTVYNNTIRRASIRRPSMVVKPTVQKGLEKTASMPLLKPAQVRPLSPAAAPQKVMVPHIQQQQCSAPSKAEENNGEKQVKNEQVVVVVAEASPPIENKPAKKIPPPLPPPRKNSKNWSNHVVKRKPQQNQEGGELDGDEWIEKVDTKPIENLIEFE